MAKTKASGGAGTSTSPKLTTVKTLAVKGGVDASPKARGKPRSAIVVGSANKKTKKNVTPYDKVTRSVAAMGNASTVCLEAAFWEILEDIAEQDDMTLSQLLCSMYLKSQEKGVTNYTSYLRCECLLRIADSSSSS